MQNEAALRSADTLLRNNGGRTVLLRVPEPPVAGDPAEDLGLSTPTFHDIELAPAVFRKSGSTGTLLISAAAVAKAVGVAQADSAQSFFRSAAGIVIDGVLFTISAVAAEQAFGTAFCYALSLTT